MKCNKRELAGIFGIAEETVTQWQKQGMPIELQRKGSRGSVYDTAAVFKWRMARAEEGDAVNDLSAERAALAKVQRERIELELAESRGQLVKVDDVLTTWAGHIGTVKQALLGLPAKAAGLVAPGKTAEAEAVLRKLIKEALTELSTNGLPRKRSRTTRRSRSDVEAAAGSDRERVG